MSYFVFFCWLFIRKGVVDQLPRLGKRELVCLLLFTCNYVVSVRRGFLFLWLLGMGCVILLWHSLGLQYNYFPLNQTLDQTQTGLYSHRRWLEA